MYKNIPSMSDFDITNLSTHDGLEKIASYGTHIPDKLARVIDKIEKEKDPNFTYLYNRALGAGEVYGPNNNGDWFGRDALIEYHPTFEKNARLYRHHQNKDPNNSIGSVPAAAYNHPLETVDLIIKTPTVKIAQDMSNADAKGKLIATSMGAKVPFDVCNICGNKAKTRMQYCSHLKSMMLKMHQGRQVFAKNTQPNFIDISIVFIPAAIESAMLRKIAEEYEQEKHSAMKKLDLGSNLEQEGRGAIKHEIINSLKGLSSEKAIATLHKAYGPLRPDEYLAVMKKDASLISYDKIPFVRIPRDFMKKAYQSAVTSPVPALVFKLEKIAGFSESKPTSLCEAVFGSPNDYDSYIAYRSLYLNDGALFLR